MSAGRIVSRLLVGIGGVWMLLTGGCTALFAYEGWRGMNPANFTTRPLGESVFQLSLMVGAVCIAPGLLALVIGLFLRRDGKTSDRATS